MLFNLIISEIMWVFFKVYTVGSVAACQRLFSSTRDEEVIAWFHASHGYYVLSL